MLLAAPLLLSTACGGADDDDQLVPSDTVLEVEAALRTNSDPNRIVVYSNNIENMIFDWKDLVHDMETAPHRPDIFLVQQLSGRDELERLLAFMGQRLGVDYDGVLAQDRPDDLRWGTRSPRARASPPG